VKAQPVGTVRYKTDGRAYVKTVNHQAFGTTWVPRAHLVWWKWRRQTVPEGWCLHHKDMNPARDVMSNLRLMLGTEHTRLHKTGSTHSAEAREKVSRANTGRVVSEETRTKMRLALTGRVVPENERLKMSLAQMGNTNALGHTVSAEARRKISQAQLGNKRWLGRAHTEATRAAMSVSRQGKPWSDNRRASYELSKKKGKLCPRLTD
jgi:hypothetical protein